MPETKEYFLQVLIPSRFHRQHVFSMWIILHLDFCCEVFFKLKIGSELHFYFNSTRLSS